ncbi:ABC transporter permease subunit [Burkholderia sp. Bp8963]|uniref:ABC transporter permease subunit n=1 Tax=Burkholderia sp. Bp8963 TaxID=2184547 RepID=UPI0021AB5000|nr:ABC transporter permease subunit [Burkholderia sp. Bp8963]
MTRANRILSASVLTAGFLFLYIPIISLVVYSFNASKLVTVWSGFSLRWYGALLHDDELLTAAWLSLKIALLTATASVAIGTWAGFVLARMGRFRGLTFYAAMINAPLVIPEVIQGISLLLLFVAMQQLFGWPAGRGLPTIWIGHVMLCLSFVAVIVQSRVKELDRSIEEAALDLGAKPWKVFFVITLPLIAQALVSGWLLAFTVSIDDVILSAFLSGPGSTTLPLVVFSRVRLGLNPEMNALATMFITVVTIGVVVVNRVMLARERRQARDVRAWLASSDSVDELAAESAAATTVPAHAHRANPAVRPDPAPQPSK